MTPQPAKRAIPRKRGRCTSTLLPFQGVETLWVRARLAAHALRNFFAFFLSGLLLLRHAEVHVVGPLALLPLLPQGHLFEHELPRFLERLQVLVLVDVPPQVLRDDRLERGLLRKLRELLAGQLLELFDVGVPFVKENKCILVLPDLLRVVNPVRQPLEVHVRLAADIASHLVPCDDTADGRNIAHRLD